MPQHNSPHPLAGLRAPFATTDAPDALTCLKGVLAAFRMIMDTLGIEPGETRLSIGIPGQPPVAKVLISELLEKADACIDRDEGVADQADLRKLIRAASAALRSYQYGNTAPDLAMEIADACDAALAASDAS